MPRRSCAAAGCTAGRGIDRAPAGSTSLRHAGSRQSASKSPSRRRGRRAGPRSRQRLLADAVAREEERFRFLSQIANANIPRSCRHAAGALGPRRAATMTSVSRCVLNVWPSRSSSLAQLEEVVDLAVEDDDQTSRPRSQMGWWPVGEVDDRQPAHGQADGTLDVDALVVGPAVGDQVVGGLEATALDRRAVLINDAADAAHRSHDS